MNTDPVSVLACEVLRAGHFDLALEVQELASRVPPMADPEAAFAALDQTAPRVLAAVVGRRERAAWEGAVLALVRAGDVDGVGRLGELMRRRATR